MSKNTRNEIEAKGQNVDQAITNGLQRLGVRRDDVDITVIDEGSRGLLGIGARDAVVRLRVQKPETPAAPKTPVVKPRPAPVPAAIAEVKTEQRVEKPAPPTSKPAKAEPAKSDQLENPLPNPDEEKLAIEVVGRILAEMKLNTTIQTKLSEPDDLNGRRINILDIQGDDLGILVGPRGETLNALQYISRLMVGHRMQERATFMVDVEGYRQRRQQALARLAERMAQKVVQRGRQVSLEPMPANERRIIHMTLRVHDGVYTESSGEGRQRKVRIIPKS
jgi:spoIIIJ-associated protein